MEIPEAVRALDRDLHALFGQRLQSVVAYRPAADVPGTPAPTLVVLDTVTAADLEVCARRAEAWHDAGAATPLVLAAHEFERSLDAYPFEFGAILADHELVSGVDPFAGSRVDAADLRRACEIQTRSHLLHLREGYIETAGRGDEIAALIVRSKEPLAAVARAVAHLLGAPSNGAAAAAANVERAIGAPAGSLSGILAVSNANGLSADAARQVFPRYLDAVEALAKYIDRWTIQ